MQIIAKIEIKEMETIRMSEANIRCAGLILKT
jgi:hypothetical protein